MGFTIEMVKKIFGPGENINSNTMMLHSQPDFLFDDDGASDSEGETQDA